MFVNALKSPRTSAPVPPITKCTPHFCSSVCTSVYRQLAWNGLPPISSG